MDDILPPIVKTYLVYSQFMFLKGGADTNGQL